ncbi:MAG: lipopolysaccharide biosynthesis protein [Geminicoccaceae bacterium]
MHGRRQIAKGAVWRVIEVMGAEFFAFAAFIISARLLMPSEVGVVAQATLFVLTAQMLLHQGLGEALIQSDEVSVEHFSSAFWTNLAVGVTVAVLLIMIAGPAARLLDEPLLEDVLQALSPILILFAASGIYQAKLRRELLLRGFAFASVLASLSGGTMAVTLAWSGYGVWSLVAQQWTYASVSLVVFAIFSGWLPSFYLAKDHVRKLGAFGGLATLSALLQLSMRRLDLLILGYFLPTLQVGFYSVANRLMMSAGMLTYYSIQQIGLPVLARLAHDPKAHRQAINRTLRLVALICLPTLIGLALIADIAIPMALGEKWLGSVKPFQMLCAFGIFYAMAHIIGQILLSAGFAGLFAKLSAINVVMFLAAVILAAPFGPTAAAFAGGIANLLALPIYLGALKHNLRFNVRQCFLDQWPIWIAAGTMIITVESWSHLAHEHVGAGWLLIGCIFTGGLTFVTAMLVLSYQDVKEICGSFWEILGARANSL